METDKGKVQININKGAQINIVNGNGKIDASQKNIVENESSKSIFEWKDNEKFEDQRENIEELFGVREYEKAFNALRELRKYANEKNEKFWVEFLYGKYYLLQFDEENENKRKNIYNAMNFFEKAIALMTEEEKESYEECHHYIINCYIRMGEEYSEARWYEKGIHYCEENILELVTCDSKKRRKYTAILDYALLLVESSIYHSENKAKERLEKAFTFFKLIYNLEEADNSKVNVETIYRYFVNAGRCCVLLAEYEGYEEYLNYAIEFYEQLLESGIINLRDPARYGMVYNNMGNVYAQQYSKNIKDKEKINKAKDCYEKASKGYKNLKDEKSYYESLSNMARAMMSLYDLSESGEEFEKLEQLLKDIIDNRFELGDSTGAYISKIQLAQLYVNYTEQNKDSRVLEKAINLYDEALEFYSKDYRLDTFYKISYGKFYARSLLTTLTMEWDELSDDMISVLNFLNVESKNMTLSVKTLFVNQIIRNFYIYVENSTKNDREKMYNYIKYICEQIGFDINKYTE